MTWLSELLPPAICPVPSMAVAGKGRVSDPLVNQLLNTSSLQDIFEQMYPDLILPWYMMWGAVKVWERIHR